MATPSNLEKYGLGSISVLIVSLCSVWGVVMVKWQHSAGYKYLIVCMLGLAVGALTGDAFLHLIPMVLGAHGHAHEESGHSHINETHSHINETDHADETHTKPHTDNQENVWKMLVVLTSLYLFFLIHLLMEYWTYIRPKRKGTANAPATVEVNGHANQSYEVDGADGVVALSSKKHPENTSSPEAGVESGDPHQGHNHGFAGESLGWMIVMGDGTHNFTDGLAIAAAFSANWRTGLATSIAILFHEVPQELGDIAAMLSVGWSYKKALGLNFLSAVTAFLGLFVGMPLAANEGAREWIFAIATGTFLYISLSNLIPEIVSYFKRYTPWKVFLATNGGMLSGFVIMLLIALFEDKITI